MCTIYLLYFIFIQYAFFSGGALIVCIHQYHIIVLIICLLLICTFADVAKSEMNTKEEPAPSSHPPNGRRQPRRLSLSRNSFVSSLKNVREDVVEEQEEEQADDTILHYSPPDNHCSNEDQVDHVQQSSLARSYVPRRVSLEATGAAIKTNQQQQQQQSGSESSDNNNTRRPPSTRRQNRHLRGSNKASPHQQRLNKSLVESIRLESLFESSSTVASSSCPSNLHQESINVMDFGISHNRMNDSWATIETNPSSSGNCSHNMSSLLDSDGFLDWKAGGGGGDSSSSKNTINNNESLSSLVDSQGFLDWDSTARENVLEEKRRAASGSSIENNNQQQPAEETNEPTNDQKVVGSAENIIAKQLKRLSTSLTAGTDRRRSSNMTCSSDEFVEDEDYSRPAIWAKEGVDIGEMRKELCEAARKNADDPSTRNKQKSLLDKVILRGGGC